MQDLPFWDLTPIFPSLDSSLFQACFLDTQTFVNDAENWFDANPIRRGTPCEISVVESAIHEWNRVLHWMEMMDSYLYCLTSTNANDDAAKSYQSQLEQSFVKLSQLETRLLAWLGGADLELLLENSETARDHAFWLQKAQVLAAHQMSEAEENLAAALSPMGYGAWAKLHSQFTALIAVSVENEGETKTLPMSEVRALASHSSRQTRKTAFEAETQAWKTHELPIAAALNGVKGFARELNARRGWDEDLAPTLLQNGIDGATLEAMQSACIAAFPDFRRFFAAKARVLKLENLAWFDLIAPVGAIEKTFSWHEAASFLEENFARYSPKLAAFSRRAFEENWMDAPPRVGKQGGAYCIQLRPGVSRVMLNFDGSFDAVSTLAHELGHAYHNLCLESRTPLQTQIPMTLAETASIFCETLVFENAVARADSKEKLALLDHNLCGAAQIVVDIHSRFLFERAVFEQRKTRELTPGEFCELMVEAQNQTYGEEISPKHPWMWAVKGHYYGSNFYNYPYTFGLLFGLGLYAKYLENSDEFRVKYDDFLSRCAMGDARTLGQEFGIDVTRTQFWNASLDVLRGQIREFETLSQSY